MRAEATDSDEAALALVERLVATPSVSGSEAAAVRVFVQGAARLGMSCEIDAAGNGLARRGPPDAAKRLALLGHIDTVPGDPPVRVENGVLHGRGAVDAKGPLAAMLVAAARADLPEGVGIDVIAAVGEETHDSPGAHFVRERLRPDACVIGEPSGWDGVTLGYKGRVAVRATCVRGCAHSAGPDGSASDELHAWWARVLEEIDRINGGRKGVFERVQATIHGMHAASDGLRQHAWVEAAFRLPVDVTPEGLRGVIEGASNGLELSWRGGERGVRSDRNDAVVRALAGAVRREGGRPRLKVKTGTADFNVVAPVWDCPIAAYGPGDSSLDHTAHEHLVLDEYLRSIRVLTGAIETLANELLEASA